MLDMLDSEIWIGLALLTAGLYCVKYMQSRGSNTVYRISSESLERSKQVMLKVLPLIENDDENEHSLLDERRLPYTKDDIKSAAKILAYFYWKKNQGNELSRVKNAYISLARFQSKDLELEIQAHKLAKEKKSLTREFEYYIARTRFNRDKAA
ncbi:hypothetical protein [Pseudodesulfovibrio piezophilus]|uniref:DUF4760 domain-containing protein n=1 Tax=Pseudodesulfovibrio piezophilus (strain DSM 21447 / JCM 15486 / C1TLV30) TaxID=1322246 RepID=M1WK88_PSEP2|nr:hypothetical protein [Pseudodesulfovibrio piezophilus]CCH49176.1 conserved protein of unknown function [Pseudodesulfovibrio piezophilus C1TLV30]